MQGTDLDYNLEETIARAAIEGYNFLEIDIGQTPKPKDFRRLLDNDLNDSFYAIIITYVKQSFRQIGRELIMGSTYTDAIQILEGIDDKKTFNFLLGYFNSMYHFMDENERENLIDDLVICTKDEVHYAGKVLRSIIDKYPKEFTEEPIYRDQQRKSA